MKKVLLPTDFSDNAWASLLYATQLFAKEKCHFYLLHTITMSASSITNYSTNKLNAAKEKAMVKLEELKERIEKETSNDKHSFQTLLSFYHLDKALNFSVEKQHIDFTVIGTKGATNMKERFLGSNTTRVIKNIEQCPTIIVPNEYEFEPLTNIAVLSDLNHAMNNELLAPVVQLATENNSNISILHLATNQELTTVQTEELNALKATFSNHSGDFHMVSNDSSKQKTVNNYIEESSTDLLVLSYYKNDVIEKMMQKSLTTSISQNPKIPMLMLPNKN